MEGSITISQEEYGELLAIKERVECAKRLVMKDPYFTVNNFCTVLDINSPPEKPKGTAV